MGLKDALGYNTNGRLYQQVQRAFSPSIGHDDPSNSRTEPKSMPAAENSAARGRFGDEIGWARRHKDRRIP